MHFDLYLALARRRGREKNFLFNWQTARMGGKFVWYRISPEKRGRESWRSFELGLLMIQAVGLSLDWKPI